MRRREKNKRTCASSSGVLCVQNLFGFGYLFSFLLYIGETAAGAPAVAFLLP